MKTLKHLTQHDLLYGYPVLQEAFCVTDADRHRGFISDLWHDCDHVKTRGEKGRGHYQFVTYEIEDITYIIWRFEPDPEAVEVLEWWYNGAKDAADIHNSWRAWDEVKSGVAYRGGRGYAYGLTAKELI